MVGLTGLLLAGALFGTALHAQDRGAARFGPVASDDTLASEGATGRLWSLATPPGDRLERRYGITADSGWTTHLQRGLLRLPHCAAALVSADGLALTSADCVRKHLDAERVDPPVVTDQPPEGQALSSLHVERLVDATTVTARVERAEADTASAQAVAQVQERLQSAAEPNQRVEVIAEAGGEVYAAYTFRRYSDVRLAFFPEAAVSNFGGTAATMSYPRQALDAALLRIYTDEGTPLSVDHFFETPAQVIRPGDAVLMAGPARTTRRAESADQLAARRDLVLHNQHAVLDAWVRATRVHHDTTTGAQAQGRAVLRTGEQARKRTETRLDALRTEAINTRLQRRDDRLREALRRDPNLRRQYGGVLDSLAALQESKRNLASAYRAFGTFEVPTYESKVFRRMIALSRDDSTALFPQMASDSSARPPAVEIDLLADRLRRVQEHLQPDSVAVRRLLDGRSPDERAASIVDNSVLADSGYEPEGTRIVPPGDPAAGVADVIGPRVRSFYEEWNRLLHSERRLTKRLVRARESADPAPLRLGEDRAPRLADGRALGYSYNGTTAPPFTTFYGLYGQSEAFGDDAAWALPERWHRASTEIDRSGPLNLAVSTDPAVHPEGAPLLNKYLEIVGVSMGTNVQGGAGAYLFLPRRMRTVGVDLRGLHQSLQAVYEAEGLVDELFGDALDRPEQGQ